MLTITKINEISELIPSYEQICNDPEFFIIVPNLEIEINLIKYTIRVRVMSMAASEPKQLYFCVISNNELCYKYTINKLVSFLKTLCELISSFENQV